MNGLPAFKMQGNGTYTPAFLLRRRLRSRGPTTCRGGFGRVSFCSNWLFCLVHDCLAGACFYFYFFTSPVYLRVTGQDCIIVAPRSVLGGLLCHDGNSAAASRRRTSRESSRARFDPSQEFPFPSTPRALPPG